MFTDSFFIYFDGLTKKNLPDFYPDGSSYDVITWMLTTQKPETKQIIHNVPNTENINYNDYKISSVRGPLPIPKNHIRHLISSSKLVIHFLFENPLFSFIKSIVESINLLLSLPFNVTKLSA